MSNRAIIVGAGQAGAQCAISLHQNGWAGEISLVGAEETAPYQRPPLSKAFLAGELPADRLLLRDRDFYAGAGIDLSLGESVTAIDRRDNRVVTSEGEALAYAKLFLATGMRPRRLDVPGASLEGVGYLRTIDDARRLAPRFRPGASLVVVGGGYIGLEVAASARKSGMNVVVVEAGERLLGRVAGPEVSAFYAQAHRARGVDVRLGMTVTAFRDDGAGRLRGAVLGDGTTLPCDVAVIGAGAIPNDEIAMYAGIEVEAGEGILVDAAMRTSDPDIYAIGDCARAWTGFARRRMRIESVANAIEQARIAAADACGLAVPAPAPPWFWSDQYDLKLQTAGLIAGGYDGSVVRGDPATGRFSVFYLDGRRLVALDAVNSPVEFNVARRIIGRDIALDPARIVDERTDARALLPA